MHVCISNLKCICSVNECICTVCVYRMSPINKVCLILLLLLLFQRVNSALVS